MKKEEKKKDNKKLLLALLLILGISIGYAALTANLNIDGSTIIKGNTWDITIPDNNFDNDDTLKDDQQDVGGDAEVTEEPTKVEDATTNTVSLTWAVVLHNPGDYYEFEADVKNEGSVDAELTSATINGITAAQQQYATYSVKYSNGTAIAVGDKLAAGQTRRVKVRVEFRDDIASSDLPTSDIELGTGADGSANTKELTVRLTFAQDS